MKTRRTKVLLSLLAVMAAGFAVTNAYTFQVQNRNPFGVLNLSKLIIKDLAHTGIILDSANNTIKVTRDSAGNGQIRVYEICDENGDNCKNIANIGQGSGGGITILDGEEGHICTKSGNNLVCNTTGSNSLDLSDFLQGENGHLCRRSGNKLICNGRFGNGQLKIIYGADQYTTIPESGIIPLDGSGTYEIYIPKIVSVTGSAQNFCKLTSDGNLECNDNDPYTLPIAASGTRGGIQIGYTQNGKNYPVVLDDNEKAYVNVPRESGEGVDATGSNGKRCKYQCDGIVELTFELKCGDDLDCKNWGNLYTREGCGIPTTNTTCINMAISTHEEHSDWFHAWTPKGGDGDCMIVCFEDEPTGGGTRVPNILNQSGYVAAPDNSTKNLVRKTDENGNPGWRTDATSAGGPTYTAGENIQISSANVISATNTWQQNGQLTNGYVTAGAGHPNKCWKTDANGIPSWLSCPTGSGSTTERTGGDSDLWKKTLNTDFGRYYLEPNLTEGTYRIALHPGSSVTSYGAASTILFDSKGIRINNGAQVYSGAGLSVEGNVMVGQSSTDNYVYIYATGNNIDPNKRFEIFGNQELAIGTQSGSYIYFAQKSGTVGYRLGVNTKNPKATLDINGGVRVGKNCEQRLCTGSNVGTIVFFSNEFLGCKQVGDTYKRVSLDGGTTQTQQLGNSNIVCKIDTYVGNGQIANTTTQQEY